MTRAEQAQALFRRGYNCAQAVVCAFAQEMGLDEAGAARLASAFGGGVGRLREVCGAVSGMALVLGATQGWCDLDDPAGKTRLYAVMQRLAGEFRRQNGSLVCRELLGLDDAPRSPEAEARTPQFYERRPCEMLVASAAEILDACLQQTQA